MVPGVGALTTLLLSAEAGAGLGSLTTTGIGTGEGGLLTGGVTLLGLGFLWNSSSWEASWLQQEQRLSEGVSRIVPLGVGARERIGRGLNSLVGEGLLCRLAREGDGERKDRLVLIVPKVVSNDGVDPFCSITACSLDLTGVLIED